MKKELKKCRYKYEIILIISLIILTFIIFFISSKLQLSKNDNLFELLKIMFDNSIGLITIWISAYFILIQLYKNTYPMEIIEKHFLRKVKIIFIYSSINIAIGVLILAKYNTIMTELYYIILFSINVCVIFYYTYRINREFKLNTYVDKYLNELIKNLKCNSISTNKIDESFESLYKFFNESIIKDEYYICNDISNKLGKFFEELITNCNSMFLKDNDETAKYIFEKIVKFGCYQISISKNCKSRDLVESLFKQQISNIKLCIKIDNISWFQEYILQINLLLKEFQNSNIIEELYYMNVKIGIVLLEKDEMWIKWFLDEIYSLNVSLKYAFKNININYFCKFLTYLMIEELEMESDNKYTILIETLKEFTVELTKINDNIQDVVIYYSLYGGKILKTDNIEKVKDFIDILTNNENRIIENEKWNQFVLYYLKISMEKWENDLSKKNRKIILDLVLDLSMKKTNVNYYSALPEYDKLISKNKYDAIAINEICDEFEELFSRLIINNNINMFFLILRLLKNSILNLEKSDKDAQKKLFKLYIKSLKRAVYTENKKYFELILNSMDDAIEELDKERKISSELGMFILEEITDIAENIVEKEEDRIRITMILYGFWNEDKRYYFIDKDKDKKKMLYKKVYNIGVKCIEDNMEEGLRTASNILGWFIIWSMEHDPNYLSKYLLERTTDLFKIAKNMQISEKTLIFMMTLFTTVGTYCCKELKYRWLLPQILALLKNEKYFRIETAIELRTKENDMWDKLFDGKTQTLTNNFLKELKKN